MVGERYRYTAASLAAAKNRCRLLDQLLMMGCDHLPPGTEAYTAYRYRPVDGKKVEVVAVLDSRALEHLNAIKARAEARLGRGLPPELASLTLTPGDIDAAEEAWFEANAHGVLRYRRAGLEAEAEEEDDTVVPGGAINPVALGTKDEGD